MRVSVIYQFASQEKVARNIFEHLGRSGLEVELIAVKTEADFKDVIASGRILTYDIAILTIGADLTIDFFVAMSDRLSRSPATPRPLIVTIPVGVTLDRSFYGSVMAREGADVVLVNRQADVPRAADLLRRVRTDGAEPARVAACLCPIFLLEKRQPIDDASPVKTLCFAVQTDVPRDVEDRRYIAKRLLEYAARHPDRTVIIKPKHPMGEHSGHPQRYPYEAILTHMAGGKLPANVVISHEPMVDVIAACDLVISVSSTALIEAALLGRRIAIMVDGGFRESLGNTYFMSSGALATFDELIEDRIPKTDIGWLDGEIDAPTIAEVIGELRPMVDQARAGALPFSSLHATRMRAFHRYQHAETDRPDYYFGARSLPKSYEQKLYEYGAIRRAILLLGDKLLPEAISGPIYRALSKLGWL